MAPHAGSTPIDLSIVFVTRNEEERIEDCIQTTTEAVEHAKASGAIRTAEYLLIDSASTDRTVEIASRFPIRILALEPHWPLSTGAGCFVGLQHVRGTYTAIINGDMRIDPNWFVGALGFMTADVAGVCGIATEELPGRTVVERAVRRYSSVPALTGPLPPEVASYEGGYSTGTILLRTEAARKVGSYNPFFRAAEDMDLRFRLMRAGWKVLNVPVHQGLHYWSSGGEPLDIVGYFHTIYRNSVGLGQMARYERARDRWVARRAAAAAFNARVAWHALGAVGLLAFAAFSLAALAAASWPALLVAVSTALAGLTLSRSRALHLRIPWRDHAFASVMTPPLFDLIRIAGFLRGILPTPRGPDEYPREARLVKG